MLQPYQAFGGLGTLCLWIGAAFVRASARNCFPPARGSCLPRRHSASLQQALELISLKGKDGYIQTEFLIKVCECVLGLCCRISADPCWGDPTEWAPRSLRESPSPPVWPNQAEVGSSAWAAHSPLKGVQFLLRGRL